MVDELEIEQGYANFYRNLNHVLRKRDVKLFKRYISDHPQQAGRLSHCLGLSDELATVEMYKAILKRGALRDLHKEAIEFLKEKGISIKFNRKKRGRRKTYGRR